MVLKRNFLLLWTSWQTHTKNLISSFQWVIVPCILGLFNFSSTSAMLFAAKAFFYLRNTLKQLYGANWASEASQVCSLLPKYLQSISVWIASGVGSLSLAFCSGLFSQREFYKSDILRVISGLKGFEEPSAKTTKLLKYSNPTLPPPPPIFPCRYAWVA